MTETSTIAFREGDKFKGSSNYYVWALKMRAMLHAEGQWTIIETEQTHTVFPVTLDGEAMTEAQLKQKKTLACRLILLFVADDLIDLIAEHLDPAIAWKTLKDQFNSGDQSQILTLMGQLQSLKLSEGGAIEDYIRKACELKNRLTSMGERLSDRNINQIVMNGLPRSYESTIQTLTHLDPTMTFDKLSASLLSKSHRRKHCDQVLGDEEALATSHHKQAPIRPPHQNGRGRWPPNLRRRGIPRGRAPPGFFGHGYFGSPRPPLICYSCGKPGHLAHDCRHSKNSYAHPQQEQKNTWYANSAELSESQLDQDWYDPYYYYWGNGPWYLDSGASSHIAADLGKLDHSPTTSRVEISEIKNRRGRISPCKRDWHSHCSDFQRSNKTKIG